MKRLAKLIVVLAASALLSPIAARPARAQLPTSEERLKVLTDPESVQKKIDKDKQRPPLELFRTQVAPFDILPFVKANHWTTLTLEARANYDDYVGLWQTDPIRLAGMPQEVVFRREARLLKTQRSRIAMQVMLPTIPKELVLQLTRPESIRPDEPSPTSLHALEPHQMLILLLAKESGDTYFGWNKFRAVIPIAVDRNDMNAIDKARYYRFVLPLDRDKPPLSAHPLTWTTISHVIWDSLPPDSLNPSQQEAMLDWLHWGGQLVIVASGPSLSILKDSFLAPYLPAETTGENKLLTEHDLAPFSQTYPPPLGTPNPDDDDPNAIQTTATKSIGHNYREPVPIRPAPNRPVYLSGLKPNPGATGIPLGKGSDRLVGVEQRVGRGRVLLLALNPADPAIASWPGIDTFVKRVLLRRPEESAGLQPNRDNPWSGLRYGALAGPDLSWVRLITRDLGPGLPRIKPDPSATGTSENSQAGLTATTPPPQIPTSDPSNVALSDQAVAEWIDSSAIPALGRDVLREASGIKIPNASFVLKVLLLYIVMLVPLNWLICRYAFDRRELAWVVVPLLSLAFAVGVERAAAYDIGYNSACDEVDVLETHAGYPRAHLSRFGSLYSTGRTRYSITYPDNPTAIALPLNSGLSLRGEDVTGATYQSFPTPSLEGYLVQPRSQSLFRAEEVVTLDGTVTLATSEGVRSVVNGGSLELRDAVLVNVGKGEAHQEVYLGTVGPGATVEVKDRPRPGPVNEDADALALGRDRFLKAFRDDFEDRPENRGEVRLVAWALKPQQGQKIEPAVDRHRGFTAVVVHLRQGPPPSPDGPTYDALAPRPPDSESTKPAPPPAPTGPGGVRVLPKSRRGR